MQVTLTTTLLQTAIFRDFTEDEIEILKNLALKITVPANTIVIEENAEDPCFYLLLAGDLVVTKKGTGGVENEISRISGVRIFGEAGLFKGIPRSASVKTTQSCTLLKFDVNGIKKNSKIYIKILENVAYELYQKLRDSGDTVSRHIEKSEIMKKTMEIDPLTGAFNRRFLFDLLNTLEQQAFLYNSSFSILMIDIDDFKKVNDAYGHPVGDEALKKFVEACRPITREPDCLCRYGGEEFVVVLHNCTLPAAISAGKRICDATNKISIPHKNSMLKFTVSIGAAEFKTPYDSVEKLIARADESLYQAKVQGKNQVCTKMECSKISPG